MFVYVYYAIYTVYIYVYVPTYIYAQQKGIIVTTFLSLKCQWHLQIRDEGNRKCIYVGKMSVLKQIAVFVA